MSTISHSQRIRQKIERILPDLISGSTGFVTHPHFTELYPEFLITLHGMMRASVPTMQTTLRRCRELEKTDRVAAAMVPYFEQHIQEELHHDEWLLQDLELLGIPRSEVLRRIPSQTVACLVGARYYWILHHHPVAELGAMSVLEGYPPQVEVIDMMEQASGFPRAAFRTMEKHAHLDMHHRDELNDTLDQLPLQQEHHELIGLCAFHTVETYSTMLREVSQRVFEEAATI